MFKYKIIYFLVFLAFFFAFCLILASAFVLFEIGEINETFYTLFVVVAAVLSIGGANMALKGYKEKMEKDRMLEKLITPKDHMSEKELKKRRFKK